MMCASELFNAESLAYITSIAFLDPIKIRNLIALDTYSGESVCIDSGGFPDELHPFVINKNRRDLNIRTCDLPEER
ncbi:hypothetical protein L2E82_22309 [Cichorium intybus]|uniref:Uncharacterized protein n=1 Tax=Cichorium intybus TaxID=13427 RepID=A0ACB9DXQ1_CICIN|nr:hypothetical protein L2E82_22309 [Cichorium intybus]